MAGDETIGNYRLLGELGRGGMGIIYKAEQTSLGRFVALKVLYPHLVSEAVTVKRFNHEARATALLNHPNIVQIFDVGVKEDMHFFAMEYVPGKDLAAVLESRGKLGIEETLRIVDQVAAALSAAGDVGIIHRDIKPSNILIDTRGLIKVTDFGIAIAAGSGELTDTGHLCGSVRYMSPEHARNEHLDSRSDLYALGIVMYEMLTGSVPFDDDDPLAVLQAHAETPPPEMPGEISPRVRALVMRCLEKHRVDRPRSPRAFRRELRECVSEVDWQGPALPPLESLEPTVGLEPDPSFRYDRAGVVRSVTDTVTFSLAERLRPRRGFAARIGERCAEMLGRRVRHRHDSWKMKRLEVMELRENVRRAEQQLEEAKRACDHAHEKYERADEELHDWQMEGSLSLDRNKKFPREAAALQEKRLWQQATSYKLQWQSLQNRVRDWYQNVERARRDHEAAVRERELLKTRRRRVAEETGVMRRNRLRFAFGLVLIAAVVVLTLARGGPWSTADGDGAAVVYDRFVETGLMQASRDEHAAALLASGHVLVTGGIEEHHDALASAEIYDPGTKAFTPTGDLIEKRFNHTMVSLAEGRGVLVIGGEQAWGEMDALASVEVHREEDGRFAPFSRLKSARTRHRSTGLAGGDVLVTGGAGAKGQTLASAEILRHGTDVFDTLAPMLSPRKDHTATLLDDGRVLIVGGSTVGNKPVGGIEVFDPARGTFAPLAALNVPRYEHTATQVGDRTVLVIGGRTGQYDAETLDSIEVIDVIDGTCRLSDVKLRQPRRTHSTVTLNEGASRQVLIVGGTIDASERGLACETYRLGESETWEAARLHHHRGNQTATTLADGSALFTGGHGRNAGQALPFAELYRPSPPAK